MKHSFLTKEILEKDYNELKNFQNIAEKYQIPRSTIERYCKKYSIKTTAKVSYDIRHDLFSTDTEESFYLAGFIAADGCIYTHKSKHPNVLQITISEKDRAHLEKIKKILGFGGPIKTSVRKLSEINPEWNDCKQVGISIYSKQIIEDLKERFEIGPNKSLTYDFPKKLINHPLVHHFMRGYFDGDGSFFISKENRQTKNKGIQTYIKLIFGLRGTISFLQTFENILCYNDIKSKVNPKINNGIGDLKMAGNNNVKLISQFLYKNCFIYLERKYKITKDLL